MKNKQQHSEQWLDGAIHHLKVLSGQAAEYSCEYAVPTDRTLRSAIEIMKQLQTAQRPCIALTQDGEVVLDWEHTSDRFKAIIGSNGSVTLYQNKKTIKLEAFTRRLTSIPA